MLKRETKTRACSELVKFLRLIRRLTQESRHFQRSNIPQMATTAGYDVPVTPKDKTCLGMLRVNTLCSLTSTE